MYNEENIIKIASRIAAEPIAVEYTTKGAPNHSFKKGTDTLRVYDNDKAPRRFTVVLSGKDWEDGNIKTFIKFNDKSYLKFESGPEDTKLGKPVVWTSLPADLRKKILDQVSGKWE